MCCGETVSCNNEINIVGIIDEDFINYKVPSMVLEFPFCSLKCDKESGVAVCQNSTLLHQKRIKIDINKLIVRYLNNSISRAIVCQGLEPMDSFAEVLKFLELLRNKYNCHDDFVIYSGYTKEEIAEKIKELSAFENVIIKVGRFIPNQKNHYDDTLGVTLASPNQFAFRIS